MKDVEKIVKFTLLLIAGIIGAILILGLTLQALGLGHFKISMPVEHKIIYDLPQGEAHPSTVHIQGIQLGIIIEGRWFLYPTGLRFDLYM